MPLFLFGAFAFSCGELAPKGEAEDEKSAHDLGGRHGLVQPDKADEHRHKGVDIAENGHLLPGEEGLYFLEVNTIPGMTSASLVPQMVRAAGMSMTDFLSTVIDNA
ncbi:MAG: hypothetical protein IIX90_06120 [Clostridia bacterium]|nr:hypothetical protein [Clostridia bacterium]